MSDNSLQRLLDELDAAEREGRPVYYVDANGNGMDMSGLSAEEHASEVAKLRWEVTERMAGRMTPSRALGEAVEELRREGKI